MHNISTAITFNGETIVKERMSVGVFLNTPSVYFTIAGYIAEKPRKDRVRQFK